MKIAVIGASGWLGGAIAREALDRGIEVTAIGRNAPQVDGAESAQADATNMEELTEAISGHDAVIGSVTDRSTEDRSSIPAAAQALIEVAANNPVGKVIWIGGGGSLHDENGTPFVEGEGFPAEYKAEAEAGLHALRLFQDAPENVDWVFYSPPVVDLYEGAKGEGDVTVQAGDEPVVKDGAPAAISSGDLAKVIVDELEEPQFSRQRITAGYGD